MAVSVKAKGAIGDGVADDTAAVRAAVAEVQANGGSGVAFFPSGTYRITGDIQVRNNGVILRGEGVYNTRIMPDSSADPNDRSEKAINFTPFTFTAQYCGIADVLISPSPRTTYTGGAAVHLRHCFFTFVENVFMAECFNGVLVEASTETRLRKISLRHLRGEFGIKFTGSWTQAIEESFRCIIDDVQADNPYPDVGAPYSHRGFWKPFDSYQAGEVVFANNNIYVCKVGGRSGGTGPTHIKGEGNDGSVVWTFASGNITWILQDSFAYSLVINKAAMLNGARAFGMYDSANRRGPNSWPVWAFIWDLEADHNYNVGVDLNSGEGVYINGSWLGSCLTGSGILVGRNHKGEVSLSGGTRILGNFGFGVQLDTGPKDVIISDCFIGVNGNSGVEVAGGATDFTITNNKIGLLPGFSTQDQPWGIFINRGQSDRYVVMGNNLTGNKIGCVSDGGSGRSKIVGPDLCDKPPPPELPPFLTARRLRLRAPAFTGGAASGLRSITRRARNRVPGLRPRRCSESPAQPPPGSVGPSGSPRWDVPPKQPRGLGLG
jgi:hypothetical protein